MIVWGVFAPRDSGGRLVAYARIRRAGNFVLIMEFLGHGEYLRDGVVKLLTFDIVKWLIEQQDPNVQGVEYLKFGALEDGGEGLVAWKKRSQMQPFLLR